jgi:hypothetical protein
VKRALMGQDQKVKETLKCQDQKVKKGVVDWSGRCRGRRRIDWGWIPGRTRE